MEEPVYDPKEEGKARRALKRMLRRMERFDGIPKPSGTILNYAVENERGKPVYGFVVMFEDGWMFPLTFEVTIYAHGCRVKPV